jgi:hypothetical protein
MIGQYCIEQDFLAIDKLCLCSAVPKWRISGQILLDGGLEDCSDRVIIGRM